jgi:hypothetical protein
MTSPAKDYAPTRAYYFKLKNMTCKIQSSQFACLIVRHHEAYRRAPVAPRPFLPRKGASVLLRAEPPGPALQIKEAANSAGWNVP